MEWKIKRLKKKILVFKSAKDNDIPIIKVHVITVIITRLAKPESLKKEKGTRS